MKTLSLAVPKDTFPAAVGEHVRVSLRNTRRRETIDALVTAVQPGCGVSDAVSIKYDNTLLPPKMRGLTPCNISGFLSLADCCVARMCANVIAPEQIVEPGEWYAMPIPADMRLDAVKIYSNDPAPSLTRLRVLVDGVSLTTESLDFDGEMMTINRVGFAAIFKSGELSEGTEIWMKIESAPETIYYEEPWRGMVMCIVGEWLP